MECHSQSCATAKAVNDPTVMLYNWLDEGAVHFGFRKAVIGKPEAWIILLSNVTKMT
jgi:hypothetical protein